MNHTDIIKEYHRRLWEQQDLTAIDEFFAADVAIKSPFGVKKSVAEMREIVQKWLAAFPDLLIKWQDYVAQDNKVVARWQATGTHIGGFFDTQPTHQEVTYSGVTIYTIADNKIIDYWALVDMHAILLQLNNYEHVSEALE